MRYRISRLALFMVALVASAAVQAAGWARAQSLDSHWGEPIELSRAVSQMPGSMDGSLIRKVSENTAWDRSIPGWYARGEALFLNRSTAGDKVLSVLDNGTFDNVTDDIPIITTDSLDFGNYEGGYRTELGRSFGNGLALEGTFYMVDGWDARAQFTSNGLVATAPIADALSPPTLPNFAAFDVDDFYQALQHTFDYRSELLNAEMNVRATWRWYNFVRSQSGGIRFLQVHEQLFFLSQDDRLSVPPQGVFDAATSLFGEYDIKTKNNLIGAQYGEEIMTPLFGSATLTVSGKVGLYANDIEQNSSIVNNGVFLVNTQSTDTNLAFVGELNVFTNIKVTDMLSIRGGYNLMWIDGVALAPEQYTFEPFQQSVVNENGSLFLHGFSLGLELRR